MQIKIGTYDLAPEIRGHRPVSNLRVNGSRVIQTAGGLRKSDVSHFDRANKETVLTFEVVREHKSIEDAMAFVVMHQVDLPTQGTVSLTMQYGVKTVRRWLANAVIPSFTAGATGLVTLHTYEIHGGAMLTEEPA